MQSFNDEKIEKTVEMTAEEMALNAKPCELSDEDLDNVAGGAIRTKADAKSKVKSLACPKCGAVGQFTHNSSYTKGHRWTCRACFAECWTEDAEDNAIMHTTGRYSL